MTEAGRFQVEDAFWALFPEARIGAVVASGLDNKRSVAEARRLLDGATRDAAAGLGDGEIADRPAVAPWRTAYRAFGAKPSKYRSSIEGLLRSARSGGVRSINPLVDLYNAVSLRHGLPCGGEDLAAVRGKIRLGRAAGGEAFVPLGAADPAPPWPGEVIYRDDAGVLCRCWNWREAERTKLTEATRDAFLCLESLPPVGSERLEAACDDLAGLVRDLLGGETAVLLLAAGRPSAVLAP
ncbi:MAG: phenylalanine--tRNA ligase beta subunit-related protein [Chloroflexota bacterium]|nr:phenylalanine--tRNA ligase beta subunit-related protein [Chloroflexota bacterium]